MKRIMMGLALAVVLIATACGGSAQTTTLPDPPATDSIVATTVEPAAPTTTTPTTTTAAVGPVEIVSEAGPVELAAPAQRIAVLSATHVEMLFAMGAGTQVIASDLFSDYPPAAGDLPQLDSFNLSVESVIELDPDLVVLTFDPGDAVAAFEAVGIPTLLFSPAPTLDAAYGQILTLGTATGHRDEAEALVVQIRADLGDVVAAVGGRAKGLTYYHETDPFGFYTPNSSSFIGQLYSMLGMENIADAAPDEFGSGYPQLSPEFIIESDPDVVFLGAFGETAATLADRDAWSTMSAVGGGRVFVVDAAESSRWGPRVVDFFEDVAEFLLAMEPEEG